MELCGLRAAATGVIVGASTAVALSWLASSKHLGRASSQQHRRIPTANINPAGGLGGESGGFGGSRRAASGGNPHDEAARRAGGLTESLHQPPSWERGGRAHPDM